MSTDPRTELRDMIAAKIDEKMRTERMDDYFDGQDYADAVMELFPDAEAEHEYRRDGWVLRYVLRTAPEPIASPSSGPVDAPSRPTGTPGPCTDGERNQT